MFLIIKHLLNRNFSKFLLTSAVYISAILTYYLVSNYTTFKLPQNAILVYWTIPMIVSTFFEIFFPSKENTEKLPISIFLLIYSTIPIGIVELFTLYLKTPKFEIPLLDSFNIFFAFFSAAMQAKIILVHRNGRSILNQIFSNSISENFVLADLFCLFLLVIFVCLNQIEATRLLLFIYGFRLLRILTLVPYFDKIFKSIIKGLRLTGNYIAAFVLILIIFSINSKILFGASLPIFKSLGDSIFTNFKIILGNGFDLVPDFNNQLGLGLYVFFVTLTIGIIFISTITALITDSLLASDKAIEKTDETPWYKRRENEESLDYIERLIYTIAFV
jgi:hypothetical protein